MTPELPRAPISEPWAMARRWLRGPLSARAVELGGHRLEGEGHVRAGVAVGHGVDVEAVDELLMAAQAVPEGADDAAEPGRIQGVEGDHGQDANLCDLPRGS